MRKPISVIIITKNEEKKLKECLESVKWAEEIVVVDAKSEDNTIKIAREYTDKIFVHEWTGFSNQKNIALSYATNEWNLSLDADERVSHELRNRIQDYVLSTTHDFDGFYVKRDNYFLGKKIRGCGWGKDFQIRIFRKSKTTITNRLVHEGFKVDGKVGKIYESLIHLSYSNFNEVIKKINHYSSLEALEKFTKKKSNIFTIIFYPPMYFFQHLILRYGFIDGIYGFFISIMHALTKFLVQIKIWELQRKS